MDNQRDMNEKHFSKVVALIGDRSRAVLLWNLIDGRVHTATEPDDCAGISRQTCSDHLYRGFRYARICYDHLAGRVAVQLTDALVSERIIFRRANEFKVTPPGEEWFGKHGIYIHELRQMKRKFAYPYLDWSERRNHLGGALGSAVLKLLLRNDWIMRRQDSREVVVTPKGRIEFRNSFAIEI